MDDFKANYYDHVFSKNKMNEFFTKLRRKKKPINLELADTLSKLYKNNKFI